jgi:predicted nucleic acid-binding Zn ribbon protein
MTFNSLEQSLQKLLLAPELEKQRHYLLARDCWYETVNEKIARHTRPTSLDRQILFVATQSAPWSQTLSLQRARLLQQLNLKLPFTLLDLRFSTARWRLEKIDVSEKTIGSHPSTIEEFDRQPHQIPKTPKESLEIWLRAIEARSQSLPPCPHCRIPTPIGELERWGICAYCFARSNGKET